ncbi:MAG: DUF5715 family protein [Bacteroidales bacterium]|jgi:hypothetical protein|nr:DUF5715 family protein [Bacteroidales bacterium]
MTTTKLQHSVKGRRKRKLKKTVKIKGIIFLSAIVVLTVLYFPAKKKIYGILHPPSIGTVKVDWYKDLNAVHLKYAERNGIEPFKTNEALKNDVAKLIDDNKLVEIKNNRYYMVRHLTHSHAYLTPNVKDFLDDLGKLFRKKLDEHDKPDYYFQISSLLRTQESQKSLSRNNGNASPNTAHLYGTTFDIPYTTVTKKTLFWKKAELTDGEASKLLSEAIGELRKEGRCVVVTERNERCFHITVTN